jgi:FimV-like protein
MPTAGEAPDSDTLMEEIFGDDEETKIAPGIAKLVEPDSGVDTREMPTAIAPDVTLSEIGTKLDLARAYIDMGDPEGAKSILEEVVKEGDEDQQAEARKLVDDLG